MPTFSGHAQSYLHHAEVRPSTRRAYHAALGDACAVLGPMDPRDVGPADMERLNSAMRDRGLSPSSRRRTLKLARAVLRRAGGDAPSPKIRDAARQVRPLGRRDAASLEWALPAMPEELAEALLVLLHTGLRLAEMRALRPADWDGELATLHVTDAKSGKVRVVDVPDSVAPILARRAGAGGERMFRFCERALRRSLARACRAAGLVPIRVHDLRHTRITQLLLAGVPVSYVSQQAGHASPGFTMSVYGHLVCATAEQRRAWANA